MIPENDTEFFQKNNRFLFVSLSLTRMRFAFALSTSACCTLFFQLFLTLARSASVSFRFPRSCSTSESGFLFHNPCLPRKEVIQPHLPIRLPCYDFTPVIGLTFVSCSLRWLTDFGYSQLPWCDGRCVQGPGTYSPRHSDSRLLATPTSCGRVAAHSPN